MSITNQERAAQVMEHLCAHDGDGGHGYSQYSRWGDVGTETIALSDGSTVAVANGDRDCSSAVIDAWEAALPGSTAGATYTGNMRSELLSTGLWEWHPMGDGYIAQRGDIYLNEVHHAAMCLSAEPDTLAQFSISETGGIDGREGDQNGWESNIKPYYDWPWDGKLVYVGPQPADKGGQQSGGQTVCGVPEDEYAEAVESLVRMLNAELAQRGIDCVCAWWADGAAIQAGVVRLIQSVHNLTPGWDAGLDVDGVAGPLTIASMGRHPVGYGCEVVGEDVWAVKMALVLNGWVECDLTKRLWTQADDAALRGHQQWHGLDADGVCGPLTLRTLLPLACA